MRFQQNGATYHTNRANMVLLQEIFPGHVNSRRGNINWLPRSYDLTQLHFFKSSTHEHLKTNIRQIMAAIPPSMYRRSLAGSLMVY